MSLNLTETRREWLAELYEANSAAVFNLCRRFLTSPEDAADASHEVFLRAAASLTEPPTSPQARAWLIRVARNHCIDLLRRRERFGLALTILAATADVSEESIQAVEDRQLLLAVLEQLSVRDRAALWQSAVERRPLAEIARSFDLSYMATAQLLSRARRRALVLAARLAVILGLAQLGRASRRLNWAQRGPQLAAAVVVPALIAVVVVGSSPHAEISAGATSPAASAQALLGLGHRTTRVTAQLPATGPTAPPAPVVASGPVASGVAHQTKAILPVPTSVGVTVPAVIDIDHGKGRDRDDLIPKHPGPGNLSAHAR